MKKWEYELASFNTYSYVEEKMKPHLDEYGEEGWEAVGVTQRPDGWTRILFKREKK